MNMQRAGDATHACCIGIQLAASTCTPATLNRRDILPQVHHVHSWQEIRSQLRAYDPR